MNRKFHHHFLVLIFILAGCTSSINPNTVDNIELVQVTHPYIGKRVGSKRLDNNLIAGFLKDFANKKEEITKFYSCYVIKIHLKNGQLISYRTNGHEFEKFKDDNTPATYFRLNKDLNIVTKYWGIPEEQFCDTAKTLNNR